MSSRALVIASLSLVLGTSIGAAQERAPDTRPSPRVQALSAVGARSVDELAPLSERAQSLLEPCRAQGRAVGGDAAARVRLTIDARGRVVAATVLAEGDVSAAARRWHRCATRALSRLRFGAGAAGSIELVARWSAEEAPGALIGDQVGSNSGHGGLGLRGTGGGGGGVGEGTIGLGRFGSGGGSGSGSGAVVPRVRPGVAGVTGSLSPEIIQRVVRRHINEVRYCYERALTEAPALAGRIEAIWTIAADGSVPVATIASDTVGSDAVSRCLVSVIHRWTFPAPEGGGIVRVTYPFVFGAGG